MRIYKENSLPIYLYHCTYIDNAYKILKDGIIKKGNGEASGDRVDNCVCLTIDPNYSVGREETPIRFVLNSKLLNDIPNKNYFDINQNDTESEIRCYEDIPLSKYLIEIDLSPVNKDPVEFYYNLIKNNIGEMCYEYEDIEYWTKFFNASLKYKISSELSQLRDKVKEL